MKKILIFILIFGFLNTCFSQTYEENLEKYWYYKHRLTNEWMYNSQQNQNGDNNIPENVRIPEDCIAVPNIPLLRFADHTFWLGHYIGVLATQYYLLSNNGQDVSGTLLEINYALEALERLDGFGELCFNGAAETNGFFIRDDVPDGFESNFPDFDDVLSDYIDKCDGNHTSGNEMSQDQVWGLFIGLKLLKKFVNINEYNISSRIVNNTDRIINRMHFTNWIGAQEWVIINPVTGNPVEAGANVKTLSWGFAKVASDITGTNQQTTTSLLWKPLFDGAQASILNQYPISPASTDCFDCSKDSDGELQDNSKAPFNGYGILTLTSLSNYIGGLNFIDAYAYLTWFNLETRKSGGYYNMEKGLYPHLLALNKTLHGNYSPNMGADFYEYFLNSAPPCGGYHYLHDNGNHLNSDPPWHTMSLFSPQHCCATDDVNRGHTNMLDYMLLYNLYFINYIKEKPYLKVTINFPTKSKEGDSLRNISKGELVWATRQLDVYSKVYETGDVTFKAGERIRFLPDFKAYKGSHVHAYIDPSMLEDIYYEELQADPCNGQNVICSKSSSEVEDIKTDVHQIYTTSLDGRSEIAIYPNPTSSVAYIDGKGHSISEVSIKSMDGMTLFCKKYSSDKVIINLDKYNSGLYILIIKSNNIIFREKIMKQ